MAVVHTLYRPFSRLRHLTQTTTDKFVLLSYSTFLVFAQFSPLATVVHRADNFIHWIGRYPAGEMCARFS